MDGVERLLHDELERVASAPQPDPDVMLRRVRRRRARGRVVVGATAVLAVAGIGAVLVSGSGHLPPTAHRPPHIGSWAALDFVDQSTGYVLAPDCPPAMATCELWLARTTDAGQTWTWRPVAGLTYPQPEDSEVWSMKVIDAWRVVVEDVGPSVRLFTNDGGFTWTRRPTTADDVVDEAPTGSLVEVTVTPAGEGDVVVVRPDGTSAVLANQPPLDQLSQVGHFLVGDDGSLWVGGSDDRRPYLFVCRNRDRTWSEVMLPADAGVTALGDLVEYQTRDGRVVYLVDSQRGRLWRTVDDGRDWQPITTPAVQPFTGIPTPDGGLWLTQPDSYPTYVVGPSDLRATPVTDPVVCAERIGARYKGVDPSDQDTTYTSPDCRTWTTLRW